MANDFYKKLKEKQKSFIGRINAGSTCEENYCNEKAVYGCFTCDILLCESHDLEHLSGMVDCRKRKEDRKTHNQKLENEFRR